MNKFLRHTDFEKRRMPSKNGLTVVELLVVIGIIAAVVAISLPAFNAMQNSFDSTGAESMINAALTTARTLAISRQQYVGVRFQTAYSTKSVLETDQYMIFVIYDYGKSGLTCGFIAVEGYKPIRLPSNVGVIDKMVRTLHGSTPKECDEINERLLVEADLGDSINITDTSAFSIVFSPAGKLVIHEIRCRNKDGASRSDNSSKDDIFNTQYNVSKDPQTGTFLQDDFDDYGVGVEKSRNKFYIYNRQELRKITNDSDRWDYINKIDAVYVNPYTGGIIE